MLFIKTGKGALVDLKVCYDILPAAQPLIYDHGHVQALPGSGRACKKVNRHFLLPPHDLLVALTQLDQDL